MRKLVIFKRERNISIVKHMMKIKMIMFLIINYPHMINGYLNVARQLLTKLNTLIKNKYCIAL